ncbi:MAG: type II toxin-antitoxin system HicB family antitoxin [bacterium]
MRQVITHKNNNGMLVAKCQSLPGCISQGKTRKEAIENIREAIKAYIEVLKEDNLRVPKEQFELFIVVI